MTAAPHMAEALKPCPFCGGEAEAISLFAKPHPGNTYVKCKVCSAATERGSYDWAVSAWNRRAPDEKDAEIARLREALDRSQRFEAADWYWRTMDPDDCGDSPEEAINRAMVGQFCVCEIASSFTGPTRYGFIAPVVDPESDDEEFVHFATQQEAIDAAKARRTTPT